MNKKIKVLHTEWSDGWGGQEIRIINEMLALREKGVEVFLACRDHAKIKEKAIQNNIKIFTLPFKGSFDIKTILALKKIIKRHKIDIINTHSGKDSWVGGFAAKLSGIKFIRTRHLSNTINPSRFNFVNEMADFIFTTGESVRKSMIEHNRINSTKILSIPTGIDETVFDPIKFDKFECRKIFDIKDNEIAIGIIAVLRKFKRHDVFVSVAKQLIKKYPELKLKFLIAGDGPQKDFIKNLIKEHKLEKKIFMLGHINNTAEFLSAIDIFTLTSDSNEGVPQSVMQALLMNKPTVATDAGSTKDLLDEDSFSLIKPTENIDIMLNELSILIYLIKNKKIVPKDTRSHIIKQFSKNTMRDKIYNTYIKLLEK
ncbi:MAG: glycosyltransferase family 4 protein [Sulfurospirillum sp.]